MRITRHVLALFLVPLVAAPVGAQWTSSTLSAPRAGLAAVTVGTQVYFAGGWPAPSVLDVYDEATSTWSTATLPTVAGWCLGAALGSDAYFSDGTHVDILDTAAGTWSSLTVPFPRLRAAMASVGTKILIAGGVDANSGSANVVDRVDIYDSATGMWSQSQLAEARADLGATVVGTHVFFAGGELFNAGPGAPPIASSTVDVYDDATATWSTATLSMGRSGIAATSVGALALFGGGALGTGGPAQSRVDLYDVTTGTWSMTEMPFELADHAATGVGTKALFAGGYPFPGNRVAVYDVVHRTWSSAVLPTPREALAAETVGSKAMFAGGFFFTPNPLPPGPLLYQAAVDIWEDAIGLAFCSPAAPNSSGLAASLSFLGFPGTAAGGSALLHVEDLPPHSFGYFLTSRTQVAPLQPVGSQGATCLGGALGRFVGAAQIRNSGPSGTFDLAIDLTIHPTPMGPIAVSAGQTWHFQAWYRDNNPGSTSNFTDALSVTFL